MSEALYWAIVLATVVVIATTGVRLTRSGWPFGTALLNVHKLVALAGVVALGVFGYRVGRGAGFSAGELTVFGLATLLAVVCFATGGVLSAVEPAPRWTVWVHRVASWVALVLGAWVAYMVVT